VQALPARVIMRSMRAARAVQLVRRALSKPPGVVARRFVYEATAEAERYLAPRRVRRFDGRRLLRACGDPDLETLWQRLAERPYVAWTGPVDAAEHRRLCPGDEQRIFAAAEDALAHRVRLLGSELAELGPRIDWLRDFKSGVRWPTGYMRDIACVNPNDASDVKVPWELSRLQWLMPAGQAYRLSGDERYAEAARALLESWIDANPYAQSVNWSTTMEVALRILSWSWLFRAFHASRAWSDVAFRERFLCALYLHGDFTERHIERSDVNGNHFTADAAGMVFAGLFFGRGSDAARWHACGWSHLCDELPRQVFPDGVDFEASIGYHRLVAELFLLPALYRRACGLEVPDGYAQRLQAMARFTAAYSRPDGGSPLWGDADDARALPLGRQALTDHRYLVGLAGAAFDVAELRDASGGPRGEAFWLLGPAAAASLPASDTPPRPPGSSAFADGGFYVMRNATDHVFVDCGPVGLAGRGGHGHNDCLAFEAELDGVLLVSDCGLFVYSASFAERNNFRSTAYHNTPSIDGQEINRIDPKLLWMLANDAEPRVLSFERGRERDRFTGSHTGYARLAQPVTPVRTIELDHVRHSLTVHDAFEGSGRHRFEVPLHLGPGVAAAVRAPGAVELLAGGRGFELAWEPAEAWALELGAGRVAPSYGVALPVVRLLFTREGLAESPLTVRIAPAGGS
jgi:uncharacterized heparinase superfamily protein